MFRRLLALAVLLIVAMLVVQFGRGGDNLDSIAPSDSVVTSLPEQFDERTISDMTVGEVAFTTPWGVWIDMDRQGWLHPDYVAATATGGTVQMRVERREDGYHVWLVAGEVYSPQAEPGYVSPKDTPYIPVVAMHS